MRRNILAGAFLLAIILGGALALSQTETTEAQGPPSFSLPAQAAEIAPGVFSLGQAIHNGRVVEGIAIAHHRDGHGGGPGGGGDDPAPTPTPTVDAVTCFSFLRDVGWGAAEAWLFDPSGAGVTVTAADMNASLQAWDTETGVAAGIFGAGSIGSGLSASTSVPDESNEAFFARIVGRGAGGTIAFTIVWFEGTTVNGVFVAESIIEWDMVFNTKFDWATDGSSDAMDFLNIATHETGHAAGMGHTDTNNGCIEQTMYPTASNGETSKRDLGVGDIAGVVKLYQ